MALLLNATVKGITQPFYIKAIDAKVENKGNVIAQYGYFANKETAENIYNCISKESVNFIAQSDMDIFKQLYIKLKTLPQFAEAVDC